MTFIGALEGNSALCEQNRGTVGQSRFQSLITHRNKINKIYKLYIQYIKYTILKKKTFNGIHLFWFKVEPPIRCLKLFFLKFYCYLSKAEGYKKGIFTIIGMHNMHLIRSNLLYNIFIKITNLNQA